MTRFLLIPFLGCGDLQLSDVCPEPPEHVETGWHRYDRGGCWPEGAGLCCRYVRDDERYAATACTDDCAEWRVGERVRIDGGP